MADARDDILAALRARPPAAPVPEAPQPHPERGGDPVERFARSLERAGGVPLRAPGSAALADLLAGLPAWAEASRAWSALPEVPSRGLGPAETPATLADLDAALLSGRCGVAENGAVWWEPADRLERAAAFLAQHVLLVLPTAAIVHDLHQAYSRIELGRSSFACFIAGPSKTADIEQSLVIGAHGPRAATVVLWGE